MKIKSLPEFIDRDTMIFVEQWSEEEMIYLRYLLEQCVLRDMQSLGRGKVIWFRDKARALMFLLSNGKIPKDEGYEC